MKASTDQLKKLGKKAAVTAVGLFAAVSLALGGVVDTPGDLFYGAPQAAQVVLCASVQDSCTSDAISPAKRERLRDKLHRLFLSQPSIVRGIVLLPFWTVGKVMIAILSLLFTALSPVFQVILGVLLNALLLFGLFILVLKLLFPNLKLKDFLTKRNVILLIAGSLLLTLTDTMLKMFWEDYRPISIAIKLVTALIVLSLLCWRIFGRRNRSEALV